MLHKTLRNHGGKFEGPPYSLSLRMVHRSDKEMIESTQRPIFVAKYSPDQGGNDFLGLRAVNTNLMGQCLPGINNVSAHLRPFSLIAWIFWKFHQLSVAANRTSPTSEELQVWRAKIEVLFTWSHVLNGVGGIPGTQAHVPKSGYAPLDFAAWKRQPSSTSLMAAIQYGPAAKSPDGLGFIEQTEHGLFRTTGFGNQLADALEKSLDGVGRPKLLQDLSQASATPKEVSELYSHWAIQTPTAKERRAFWSAFYSESAIGGGSRTGDRSATLSLILQLLQTAKRPLTVDEIRSSFFHGMILQRKSSSVPKPLVKNWHRWICLQVRQAQRLALESLLGWLERRLIEGHERDTETIAGHIEGVWQANTSVLKHGRTVSEVRSSFAAESLQTLLLRSFKDEGFSIFVLMDEVRSRFDKGDDLHVVYALRSLFLCAEYVRLLSACETIDADLSLGGAERISLRFWLDSLDRSRDLGIKEFILLLLEQHIISQHLAVAARRYDGGTQRLRISIEEEGLTALAGGSLQITVTPDRLFTALSLMAECKVIQVDTTTWTFFAPLDSQT